MAENESKGLSYNYYFLNKNIRIIIIIITQTNVLFTADRIVLPANSLLFQKYFELKRSFDFENVFSFIACRIEPAGPPCFRNILSELVTAYSKWRLLPENEQYLCELNTFDQNCEDKGELSIHLTLYVVIGGQKLPPR